MHSGRDHPAYLWYTRPFPDAVDGGIHDAAIFLLVFAFVSVGAVRGDDCSCWTPSAEDIVTAEATIAGRALPLGSLDRYVRYYAGATNNGRRFMQGKLIPIGGHDTPGTHVVERRLLPLQGEGCITSSESGGAGLSITCAHPGAWTPSEKQIAELEALLQLPENYYHLQDYARYYAGVTEGDRRIVIGRFLVPVYGADWTAGIHVVSDSCFPLAFDLGCALVNVRYDLSTKEISSQCGESFGGRKF